MVPRSTSEQPTVIFVHGLRTSQALWTEQVRVLTEAGFPTLTVDLPGHGVHRDETFTMAGAAKVLDEAVSRTGPAGYVLVGLSLGGYTVLNYAARERRRADAGAPSGLVGVLAAACSSDPSTKPIRAYRDVSARVVALGSRLPTWARNRRRKRASVPDGAQFERLPWSVVTDALTALDAVSSIADLVQIDAPVLLVNGRWDHLRLEERAYLAAAPNTKLTVIPRAKHDVSLEAPIQFNRVLLDFVSSLDRPQRRTPLPQSAPSAPSERHEV